MNNLEVRLLVTEDREIALTAETQCLYHSRWCTLRTANRFMRRSGQRGDVTLPPITARHVRMASERLRRVTLLGLTDRMSETVALWQRPLPGLNARSKAVPRICGNLAFQRCGGQRAPIPPSLQEKIERDNWGSMALWSLAQALFEQQLHGRLARSREAGV